MRYFIAYSYNNGHGNGCAVVNLAKPIQSGEDINIICQMVAAKNGFDNVVLTSLTPLPSVTG